MLNKDNYEIKISNQARNDLKDIFRYIKNVLKEPDIAKKYARINEKRNW